MGCTSSVPHMPRSGGKNKGPAKNETFQTNLVAANKMSEFDKHYEMRDVLGEGITGSVHKIVSKETGKVYAMKTINLGRVDKAQLDELRNEIEILRQLDHPNVINLFETYEDKKSIKIVMEFCTGGELAHRHLRKESQVISVVAQLLSAIKHCHRHGVVHRDLKLENIVFLSEDVYSPIKLIDFGLSNFVAFRQGPATPPESARLGTNESGNPAPVERTNTNTRLLMTMCGTAYYMAPEVLEGAYSQECDLWSIGVITYMLLTGHAPFDGRNEQDIFRKLRRGKVRYDSPVWTKISPHAKELVEHLLIVDPEQRWTAAQALESKWFEKWRAGREARLRDPVPPLQGRNGSLTSDTGVGNGQDAEKPATGDQAPATPGSSEPTLEKSVVESLQRFASYTKLRKAALMVVAHNQTFEQIKDLRDAFVALDKDNSGTISLDELRLVMERNGVTDKDRIEELFRNLDQGRDGEIRYLEFLAATVETRCVVDAAHLSRAFDHLDTDKSGYITVANLRQLLGKGFTQKEVEDIIQECDLEGVKKVSRKEFLRIMSEGHARIAGNYAVPVAESDSDSEAEDSGRDSRSRTPPTSLDAARRGPAMEPVPEGTAEADGEPAASTSASPTRSGTGGDQVMAATGAAQEVDAEPSTAGAAPAKRDSDLL